MSFCWPLFDVSFKHYTALSRNACFVRFVEPPYPNIRAARSIFPNDCSNILLCAFQEAFLLKPRTDDNSEFTLRLRYDASSEMRKRQRLRIPIPIGCAGTRPVRAIFLMVIGLRRKKAAASSGVTKGSFSDLSAMQKTPFKSRA